MKPSFHWLAGLWVAAAAVAQETPPATQPPQTPPRVVTPSAAGETPRLPWQQRHGLPPGSAWLGLRVTKVTPELRSQVPNLPEGVGFVVDGLDDKSPAEGAGLRRLDVIWQLDDQFLVNEAQLAVLLGMRKPGQVVEISYFRAGQAAKVNLTLGTAPAGAGLSAERVAEQVVIARPGAGLPVQIVDVLSRTATIENSDGRAVLVRGQDGYQLTVTNRDGATVWDGTIPKDGNPTAVPVVWRERAISLRQALEQSSPCQNRRPRLRVVPPASGAPAAP